ncbi:tetratricopeptide repeat protein [Isoptericola sp. BMS4]|uniref:tetratricopeptide repeat protein n=1 Tax=Isoptericola sp. BMS4 TaxID=2527875 RepID=UPI00141FAC42|nr:tetratricopeptide repeat protein [Isoptericola sp. BMS4]
MLDTTERDVRRAYGDGKSHGERFRGQFGPVQGPARGPLDDLARLFTDLSVDRARGVDVSAKRVDDVRRAAVGARLGDWSGLSLGVVAALAAHFEDPLSQGWLPVMLAEHGRFTEAVEHLEEMPDAGAPGWPRAKLVTALWELGRYDEARELMCSLQARFDTVRESSVSVWDEGPVAAEYARLRAQVEPGSVPVFLHLPFSGGTSMISALKNVVPWGRMIEIQRRFGLLQLEVALERPLAGPGRPLLVHLHHPVPLELPGLPSGADLRYFTVLRDPVSQIRSGFYKRISAPGIVPTADHGRSADFAQHVEYTTSHGLTNMLARQIVMTHPEMRAAARAELSSRGVFRPIASEEDMFWFRSTAHLSDEVLLRWSRETLEERFTLVGTMRHLGASHLAAVASTGLPVADRIGHHGRSGQPATEGEADPVRERLRDANWVDQQLFEEYTARFERDHATLLGALDAEAEPGVVVQGAS